MERKAGTARSDLEQLLADETAEPKALPLSLLKDITGDFSDDRVIGRGGYAVVYKGILGDRAVAVKKLCDPFMDEREFHREVECLMRVKHKNVVRFLGYCSDRQGSMERYDGKLVMADVHQRLLCFEYIPKGSLDKYIIDAHHEWGSCYKMIKGICEGLQYLHENHIIHLDLKPANILLDHDMVPKITDFGLSRCLNENQSREITKTISGTIGYLAPEFRHGGVIARSADLYSLGVIIIEIIAGQKAYQPVEDVLESWSSRLERSQRDTLCEQIQVCCETALECRKYNPKKRPASAQDIIDRLHEMERIQMLVDETAYPKALPFTLLEDITCNFSNDQEIGRGGFSVVYKGILGERAVIVKRLCDAQMYEKKFHQLVECLMRVKHKNVVRFLGYCADIQGSMESYNEKLVMADVHLLCFEYVPNGSLDKYIIDAYREWRTCYKIIKGICEGLQFLHENHIIHLDLKPANILLDDIMVPKITDFGLSRCFHECQSWDIGSKILGSVGYLAPELYNRDVTTCSVDLYSLGVIIIEILTGQKGYQATKDVLDSWSDRLERSQRDTLCEQIRVCYEIALECVDFNPKKRPASARDIIDRLHEMESIQATFYNAMTNPHGENWEEEHQELDAQIIYEAACRMPHGRQGIADELFSKTENSNFNSRRVMVSQLVRSAREDRLERENNRLQQENNRLQEENNRLRSLAEKGVDFDGLMQSVAPDLATSDSEVGFERG